MEFEFPDSHGGSVSRQNGPDSPDGTAVRAKLIKQLEKKVDPGQLRQAAADFLAAHGDPTPLLDLGFVPPEVGVAAGYPCASEK